MRNPLFSVCTVRERATNEELAALREACREGWASEKMILDTERKAIRAARKRIPKAVYEIVGPKDEVRDALESLTVRLARIGRRLRAYREHARRDRVAAKVLG